MATEAMRGNPMVEEFRAMNNSLKSLVNKITHPAQAMKERGEEAENPNRKLTPVQQYFKGYDKVQRARAEDRRLMRKGITGLTKTLAANTAKVAGGITLFIMALGALRQFVSNLFGKKTPGQEWYDKRHPDEAKPLDTSIGSQAVRTGLMVGTGLLGLGAIRTLVPGGKFLTNVAGKLVGRGTVGGAKLIGSGAKLVGRGTVGGAKLIGSVAKLAGRGSLVAGRLAGKGATKLASKGVLKSVLKKIPVVSLVAGAALALPRYLRGDTTGAAMEMGSGIAGMIPGVGTAASLALDAGIMARDISEQGKQNDVVKYNKLITNNTLASSMSRGGGDMPAEQPFPMTEQEESTFRGMVRALQFIQETTTQEPVSQVHGYEDFK